MKQPTRSAAALVTTSLLAGGGIVAAVTGLTPDNSAGATADSPQVRRAASTDPELAAAVRDLMRRSETVHARVLAARHELRDLDRKLDHQRGLARHVVGAAVAGRRVASAAQAPSAASGWAGASAQAPAASSPSVHTTTGASGSSTTSSAASAPSVHTTTGASGAGGTNASSSSSAPQVHTTTGASGGGGTGSGTGGGSHESEHEGSDD